MSESEKQQAAKAARIAEFEDFKPKFPLLSRVRDRVSSFTGTVVYITFSYWGPPAYGVQPHLGETNPEYRNPAQFSEGELVLVSDGAASREKFIADGCEVRGRPAQIRPLLIELGATELAEARKAQVLQAQAEAKESARGDNGPAPVEREPDPTPAPPPGSRRRA